MQVAALIQILSGQNQQAEVEVELNQMTANIHGILHYTDDSGQPYVVISGDIATMKPLHSSAQSI
jgi:uncharacterized cupin superfamily protein